MEMDDTNVDYNVSANLDAYLADCGEGGGMMKCPVKSCYYQTNVKNNMKSHFRYVHGEKKFKCTYCNYSSASKRNVTRHEQVHARVFFCASNGGNNSVKPNRSSAASKKLTNPGEYSFTTFPGQAKVNAQAELAVAKKRMGNGEGGNVNYFRCKFCAFKSPHVQTLNEHIRRYHREAKPYSCALCGATFATMKNLTDHLKTDHTDANGLRQVWKCKICGIGNLSEQLLQNHMITSHQKAQHVVCRLCGFKAASARGLQHHMSTEHPSVSVKKASVPTKRFVCSKCSFTSTDRTNVQLHIQTVHKKVQIPGLKPLTSGAGPSGSSGIKNLKFKCTKCFTIAKSYDEFREHSKLCRMNPDGEKKVAQPKPAPKQFVLHNTTITLMDFQEQNQNTQETEIKSEVEEEYTPPGGNCQELNFVSFASPDKIFEPEDPTGSGDPDNSYDDDEPDPSSLMTMEFDDSLLGSNEVSFGSDPLADYQNGSESLNTPPGPYYHDESDESSPESRVPSPASLSLRHVMDSIHHVMESVANSEIIINSESTHPYQCEYCDFDTGNVLRFFQHMIKHTGKKFFKCSCSSCQLRLTPSDSNYRHCTNGYAQSETSTSNNPS